jgi:hypothetical protein
VAELPDDKSAVIRPADPTYHPVDLCYLRKINGRPNARGQLTAFLTSLFKAVESSPRAALVYTLAVGKDGKGSDAYSMKINSSLTRWPKPRVFSRAGPHCSIRLRLTRLFAFFVGDCSRASMIQQRHQ